MGVYNSCEVCKSEKKTIPSVPFGRDQCGPGTSTSSPGVNRERVQRVGCVSNRRFCSWSF